MVQLAARFHMTEAKYVGLHREIKTCPPNTNISGSYAVKTEKTHSWAFGVCRLIKKVQKLKVLLPGHSHYIKSTSLI